MGTPEFAVCSLNQIHQSKNFDVVGVVTAADRPAGRGRKLKASAVKEYALEHDLTVLQPLKLRDPEFLNELEQLKADVFVVVAFRMLPEVVWKMPPKGTINLHGSLLPQYRGAAPINWAIINGETKTGATTFFINERIDEGEMILHTEINIGEKDNVGHVHDKLMQTGAELLLDTLTLIDADKVKPIPQDFNQTLKAAPKLTRDNTRIQFDKNAKDVLNFIRGLSPYPGAYTFLQTDEEKIQVKIFDAEITENEVKGKAGSMITDGKNTLVVACSEGSLMIHELQIQGKKRMKTGELLNGFRIDPNSHWG